MFGTNLIRRASGLYVPPLIGLAGKWKFLPCGEGNCCSGAAPQCCGGSQPDEWSVALAGLVDDHCPCSTYNNTFVLAASGTCEWDLYLDAMSCPYETYGMTLSLQAYFTYPPTVHSIFVKLVREFDNDWVAWWFKTFPDAGFSCLNLSNEDIPLYAPVPSAQCRSWRSPFPACCDESAATCHITAV